ncbi:MAG: LysR family transcriptional regulator [Pseudomonadota bacterium]
MNELNSLRAFVKVVEAGSFAEAARQMGAAKSVITKRVNQLEQMLQIELLQRSTRRLTITDTGTALYERCVPILAELEEVKSEVCSMEWGLSGTFRVSCPSSFTAAYLARDLIDFQNEYPNLKIYSQQHDRTCDPVQEGFDVCLQPTSPASEVVESVPVLPLRRMVVATPGYLAKFGEPDTPMELAAHRFAHNNHVQPKHAVDFLDGNKTIHAPFAPVVLTNTVWQLRAAVLWGDCMAMMPAFFIEDELISGELVPVLPGLRVQSATLSAFFRQTPFVPMKVRIFLNFLRQRYGDFPPWERRLIAARPEFATMLGPRPTAAS